MTNSKDILSLIEDTSVEATYLDLGGKNIEQLPPEIARLSKLQNLRLCNNRLTTLPKEIGMLRLLQELDLSDNLLTELPQQLRELTYLEKLNLDRNPDLNIPPEILHPSKSVDEPREFYDDDPEFWSDFPTGNFQGGGRSNFIRPGLPRELLTFYFESRDRSSRQLNEAKILVVGEGTVGKTSLVRRLTHDKFNPGELKTEGIDIAVWSVNTAANNQSATILLNVWDFGGQEIMHATHRFFLTERSLYLLVLDARRGENESNIQYWLKIIQSYGEASPVVIVVNKCDEHRIRLNESRLIKDHPNVQGVHYVSCATGEGIDALGNGIATFVCRLPHVFNRLPLNWFKIKEELVTRAKQENYLSYASYLEMCFKYELSEERSKCLLRFLHDLGTVLHYDDVRGVYKLHETNILNPEWVTRGVYKIINNRALATNHFGRLSRQRAVEVLADPIKYPADKAEFILGMMQKFELCFEFLNVKDPDLLIPELLPANEPDLNWDMSNSVKFQYHYDVLPEWIICRFIVRMGQFLTAKPTFWRTGVVLEIEGNRALVRSDAEDRRIVIFVTGPDRPAALSIIRSTFQSIHSTIPGIKAVEKIPLPDEPTVAVDYAHVRMLLERGVEEYIPEGTTTNRKYSPQAIINAVFDPGATPGPTDTRKKGSFLSKWVGSEQHKTSMGKTAVACLISLLFILVVFDRLLTWKRLGFSVIEAVTGLGILVVFFLLSVAVLTDRRPEARMLLKSAQAMLPGQRKVRPKQRKK